MESPYLFYPKDAEVRTTTNARKDKATPPGEQLNAVSSKLQLGSNPVSVVGIIGKSSTGKSPFLNFLVDRSVFQPLEFNFEDPDRQNSQSNQCCIEFYHDTDANTIYLNLISVDDHCVLSNICSGLDPSIQEAEFHQWLEKQEYHHIKALLFLFLSCHIILIYQNDHNFDISYLRILRALSSMKQLISPNITNYFNTVQKIPEFNSQSNYSPGRCTPSLSFIFNDSLIASKNPPTGKNSGANTRSKLQSSLEAQIRLLFKKSASDSTSLFTTDQGHLAHVVTVNSCPNEAGLASLFPYFGSNDSEFFDSEPVSFGKKEKSNKKQQSLDGLDILQNWIESKGKMMSHNSQNRRDNSNQLPSSKAWFWGSLILQDLFLFGRKILGRNKGDVMEKIKGFLDPEYKFSTSRCREVLSTAKDEYFRELPSHYTTKTHQEKITRMKSIFDSIAIGPSQGHFWNRLVEECTQHWQNDHQLCDAISLTLHACTHPRHYTPDQEIDPKAKKYPVCPHVSTLKVQQACNCGRTQSLQEDPFDFKSANETVFQGNCCNVITLPTRPVHRFQSDPNFVEKSIHLFDMPGMKVSSLGGYAAYNPDTGLGFEGFLNDFGSLLPWDIPREIFQRNTPLTTGKKKKEKAKGLALINQQRLEKERDKIDTRRGYFGLEYCSSNGQRFILNEEAAKASGHANFAKVQKLDATKFATFLDGIPLFLKSPTGNIAQLQRIYVVIPRSTDFTATQRVIFAPAIQFCKANPGTTPSPATPENNGLPSSSITFQLRDTVLPFDSFLCFRLPYLYPDHQGSPIKYNDYTTVHFLDHFLFHTSLPISQIKQIEESMETQPIATPTEPEEPPVIAETPSPQPEQAPATTTAVVSSDPPAEDKEQPVVTDPAKDK